MTNNVIAVDFTNDNSGYIMSGDKTKKVDGIYVDNLCGYVDNKTVAVGQKMDDGVGNAVTLSLDEMNRFCLMWLAIYEPSVLVEGEE